MRKYTNSETCLIWLDSFVNLEYKHKQEIFKLIDGKENIKALIEGAKDYIVSNVGEEDFELLKNGANKEYLSLLFSEFERKGVTPITILSTEYPEKLKSTPIPPLVLYTMGDLSLLNSKCFAVVGSRKSIPLTISLTEEYAKTLSKAGFTLVTGIAEGVDKTVLETALSSNGKVISVIAGGFSNVYPKNHASLLEHVSKEGLVISEHPDGVIPKPYMFPVRNRIIAGLSDGVLVCSAGKKSGTIYTAEYAEEYSRNVFAIPYSVNVASGEGCNDLIKRGAILTDNPSDILIYYGLEEVSCEKPQTTLEEDQILKYLENGEAHIEKICKALSKKVYEITPLIASLEIKGYITQAGINVYTLV